MVRMREKIKRLRKESALEHAASVVAGYAAPVDIVATPDNKTIIIITDPDGLRQAITVNTGNMSQPQVAYLQKKLRDGAQLSVMGYDGSSSTQSNIVAVDDSGVGWVGDIQPSDKTLSDTMTRYKSVLTRIYNMCMLAVKTDDTNMKATLKTIIAMIDDDI